MTRKRTYDVRAYGADAIGVSDASAAIVAAAEDASANGGGTIVLEGQFKIASQAVFDTLSDLVFDATRAVFSETVGILGGGSLSFEDCERIRWIGGRWNGADTITTLKAKVEAAGIWLDDELGPFDSDDNRLWPSPNVNVSTSSDRGYLLNRVSAVFRLLRTTDIHIERVWIRGKECVSQQVNDGRTVFDRLDYEGVLENCGLETIKGTEGRTAGQDKQIILWCYAHHCFGTYGMKVSGPAKYQHCAGCCVAGVTNTYRALTGLLSNYPQHLWFMPGVEIADCWDNGLYLDGCFDVVIDGLQIHDMDNNYFVKMHGSGFVLANTQMRNGGSGVQFAGQGTTPSLDDYYGRAGLSLKMVNCKVQNTRLQPILIQSDSANYPRGVLIDNNEFLSVGMAREDTLGPSPYDDGGYGAPAALSMRFLPSSMDVKFTNNRIDNSQSGLIASSANASTYDANYAGYVAFVVGGAFHTLDKRCFIKVEGHSVSGYDGYHYVQAIGRSGTSSVVLITSTTYSSAGTGGIWRLPQPDFAISTEKVSSETSNPRLYGLEISHNKFYRNARLARLTRVGRGKFFDNEIIDAGAVTAGGQAMFSCEDVINSRFEDNRGAPSGTRIVFCEDNAIYSGNTERNNDGLIDTARRDSTFRPTDLPELVVWWSMTESSLIRAVNGTGAWGDVPVTSDGQAVASWADIKNGHILAQSNSSRRPLYKTNIVNGMPGLLFDGTDDFLRAIGEVANGTRGTVIVIATPTRSTAASTLDHMLDSRNENGGTPSISFIAWGTKSDKKRMRFRLRNGANDIQCDGTNEWTPSASVTRMMDFTSDATGYDFRVSDGAGAMAAWPFTGSTDDGKWWYDTAPVGTTIFRQSVSVGAALGNYQLNVSPTYAGTAGTFFQGYIHEILIFDGDVDSDRADIWDYFFHASRYGAI